MTQFLATLLFLSACASPQIENDKPIIPEVKPPLLNPRAELSSSSVMPGTILLVKVSLPLDSDLHSVSGQFEGIEIPFYESDEPRIYEGVLGIPYERKSGPGIIKISLGDGNETTPLSLPLKVVKGKYTSEILHVDGRRVHPGKKDMLRIKREQEEIAKIYERTTRQKYWKGPFTLPIQSRVTSPFGTKRIFNGELRNFHPGLDLKAPIGTPIYSAAAGVVAMAKNLFYTGNTVVIDHGYGIITLYAHMSKIRVKVGQTIAPHEELGLSGKTGRVNGPHLHWQAVVHHVKIDPIGLTQVIQ